MCSISSNGSWSDGVYTDKGVSDPTPGETGTPPTVGIKPLSSNSGATITVTLFDSLHEFDAAITVTYFQ